MSLLIKKVTIANAGQDEIQLADVWIENGTIKQIGQDLKTSAEREIDGQGKVLLPGMYDMHVHLREPGAEVKETIASGTEAAINGGITGLVMMPNTTPCIDSAAIVRTIREIAAEDSRIPLQIAGSITKGRAGVELSGVDGMRKLGVKMLTDDPSPVADPSVLMRAMEYASELGLFFASHCATPELQNDRAINHGEISYQLGIKGTPACGEEMCIDRDIRLAQHAGAHVHIQHVSTAAGVEIIRQWKARGASVSAEVTPHHLMFDESCIGNYDTNFKVCPPLRLRDDCEALLAGLNDGTIDVIATDHAPHTPFEKLQDFMTAPNGIIGLETALISLFDRFVSEGKLSWSTLAASFSANPRKLMGEAPAVIAEGEAANLVLFDPAGETTFSAANFKSNSQNTPFIDQTLKGAVELVVLGDKTLKA
ncbi:dihydroorotase [Persicirhabdus sediminis]|uniref:Dihydroorotase n=1 Tax=Persicirhabdus sediminis TaxID=454144 RepID=A0A8J7SJY0_9BACT|nr:dihydroorotase [Persicirhabdus sediminis]MBK1791396.1 dihydroorotase [Persicirhabdus sediminis]